MLEDQSSYILEIQFQCMVSQQSQYQKQITSSKPFLTRPLESLGNPLNLNSQYPFGGKLTNYKRESDSKEYIRESVCQSSKTQERTMQCE